MNARAVIHFGNQIRHASFEPPRCLGEILNANSAQIDQPCGGQGKCGKCRVRASGALRPAEVRERERLTQEELAQGVRLACMAVAEGSVELWLKEREEESILTQFTLPDLPDPPSGEGLGLAIDIGTTTLAAYLYEMKDRVPLAVDSQPNPQRAFGADVISRLKTSLEGGQHALKSCIDDALGTLSDRILARAGRNASELHTAVVTGNTAMLYLLTGEEVSTIAFAPFELSTHFGKTVSGAEIGLPKHVRVYLPSCVAAYVGADITCAMLYAGFLPNGEARTGAPILLADIGTNGEMALSANGKLLTCSTAAGPAFEGAGIRCGMTAQDGAIHRVDYAEGHLTWSVIGGGAAKGLCGSGLVDTVAALLDAEVIDETGRLLPSGHPFEENMTVIDDQPAFHFPDTDVLLTQADVRAVQLAKAAICAGMMVLMEEAGIDPESISQLKIAGGFGSCIRPSSAERIGLIPEGFAQRTQAIGNAAGAGAALMLLSESCKERGEILRQASRTIELSSNPSFSDCYIDCMMFE